MFEAGILVPWKSGGPPEGGLGTERQMGASASWAWVGPSAHPKCPCPLAAPRTLLLSGPVASLVLVPGPRPPHPTDCSLSSPPWLLPQGAFPSGASHCPFSPVTPHPLCCPSPLHSQGLFQKHKSAQSPGYGSQTLAK